MFAIYTPETRQFLRAVIPTSTILWLEWDRSIHQTGTLPNQEDAIMMAQEVQDIRSKEEIFHYGVQVIRMNNGTPDLNNPVFELLPLKKII